MNRFVSWMFLVFAVTPVSASSIQRQPPEKIFAANCATCHGARGQGGLSWVDGVRAPGIAGAKHQRVWTAVRRGSTRAMPAFAEQQITPDELDALAQLIEKNPGGIPAPKTPSGSPVVVNILDADPWYADDGADLSSDRRRVELSSNQYLKVVNTGKTWHTITDFETAKDSGFIGYNQYSETGYYYADQKNDLAPGCVAYHCHLHPYMQMEVCTSGNSPRALTRAGKKAQEPPAVPGVGEIWVDMQTQEENDSDGTDGAMQVIDAGSWNVAAYIPNVGNNPHSAWLGRLSGGKEVLITTSWHDNIVTLVDAEAKSIIAEASTGAAASHVQVSPKDSQQWVLTHHGSDGGVMRIDPDRIAKNRDLADPVVGQMMVPLGANETGSHGVWFCDDGDHFITANTFANTVSLYSLATGALQSWAPVGGKFPLNAAVMHGDPDGCRAAYTTNADSDSVSIFDVDVRKGKIARRVMAGALADPSGNLALTDTLSTPVRWAHAPIQSLVSPPDATAHGRYMVISNKTSFNVSIAKLDEEGVPTALYNFPAGLGAHGVTFGRKSMCDNGRGGDICYYAYVANSFEDYLSVYDLEKIETGAMGIAGSAREPVRVEGGLVSLLCEDTGIDCSGLPTTQFGPVLEAPITALCPDCRSGVHVGDVPMRLTTVGKSAYLKVDIWVDARRLGGSMNGPVRLDLDVVTNTGGFGTVVRPAAPPW